MIAKDCFQSSVAATIVQYISLKQALGRSFESASFILLKLDRFLCNPAIPSHDLTEETFGLWCRSMESLCSNTKLDRMHVVRNFCIYRRRTIPDCFVPDQTQFPKLHPRIQPHIFSDTEIACLIKHSDCVEDTVRSPLRGSSTRLAIILLYTTGLRRGELLRLTASDYDPSARSLLIQSSKFHKSRLLPLPNDVALEVEHFLKKHRAVRPPLSPDAPLLWSHYCGGRAYSAVRLTTNIHIPMNLAGIKKPDGRLPRIHDFRFSFAVNALIRWYQSGADVQAKLPFLSVYMGHVSVLSTYHYLRFIEPLASQACATFGAHYGALIQNAGRKISHES